MTTFTRMFLLSAGLLLILDQTQVAGVMLISAACFAQTQETAL